MKKRDSSSSDSDESEYEDSKNSSVVSSDIKSESLYDSSEDDEEVERSKNKSSDHVEFSETDESRNSSIHESKEESGNLGDKSDDDGHDDSDDDEVKAVRRSRLNRILDSDSSDEEEVERRKTIYKEEPEGDLSIQIEEAAFSKATRRSIFGHQIKPEPVSQNEITVVSDDSDDESDIIECSSEDESEKQDKIDDNSAEDHFDQSGLIEKKLSSTIRSPLRIKNESIEKEDSFNLSISSKHSSTISESKNESHIKKVSRASFDRFVAEKESVSQRITSLKKIVQVSNGLPDGGKKLQDAIVKLESELQEKEETIKSLVVDDNESVKNSIKQSFFASDNESMSSVKENQPINLDYMYAKDVQPKYTGKVGIQHFEEQKKATVEKLQDIQTALDERPADEVVATPPKYLKVELMRHQLHAIAFMAWRETKSKPRGGILADDMGLGKTLTVIALILKQLQAYEARDEDEEDTDTDDDEKEREQEWISRGHRSLRAGGTLVIAPATLLKQWEDEIKKRVKSGALEVNVFHGPKRCSKAKELAQYDVVITTYQIAVSEHKNDGCLFGVKWDRVVLDEGHVTRNYRSKQSEAVCALISTKRWVLTGTPIQNKEFDVYATIKFLRCTPFDDLRYWRTWIETRGNKGSSPRLQALLKAILLRRTKQQLMESGEIQTLPEKHFETVNVKLNREEKNVYSRIMARSQAIFAQYLAQQAEKRNDYTYDHKDLGRMHKQFAKSVNVNRKIEAHEILTLILRLRQVCCHPGLAKSMIEADDIDKNDLSNVDNANESDHEIINQLKNLNIGDINNQAQAGGSDITQITTDSQVFSFDMPSSKIETLMDMLRERLVGSDDKAIIVSQWVGFLNIIKAMLEIEGIEYCELNGKVAVKDRNDVVVNFNKSSSKQKVMLLSITAGGVGLNLVGANQLYIMDPHWNPQIEQQAQDRIYRFGQTKNVKIVKFICEDTIEEKILKIQQSKLELAISTLTGAKRNATKLTIDDLKSIFGMN